MKKLLLTLLILLLPNVSFAAIAHYASYDATNNFSFSMDGGSGNRVIVFSGSGDTTDNISGVTWNGEAFTKFVTVNFAAIGRYNVLWCLVPTGTGSQTFTASGITGSSVMTVSVYTGAGNCKNNVTNSGSGATSIITASPAPASTSWIVGGGGNDASAISAGSNTTMRSGASSQGQADSNGVASPTALNFTHSSGAWATYAVEIPEAVTSIIMSFWQFFDY